MKLRFLNLVLSFLNLKLRFLNLVLSFLNLVLSFLNLKLRFLNLVLTFLNLKLKWCSPILHHMTTADILEGLSLQRVCKVSRISPSSDMYKLSFDVPTPPASLTLCPGHTVRVRPAYPLPTRCYKCQHYGHSHLACKSKQAVCGRCSHPLSDNHSPRTCSREPLCFHCKTPTLRPHPVAPNI